MGEAIASTQADATQTGVLCLRKMASAVLGMTQHRDPGSCSFSFLPDTPQVSIVHSVLPLSKFMVSGCKQFVHFKSLSGTPAVSLLQRDTPLLFTDRCYLSSFLCSGAVGRGA